MRRKEKISVQSERAASELLGFPRAGRGQYSRRNFLRRPGASKFLAWSIVSHFSFFGIISNKNQTIQTTILENEF